MRPFSSHEMVHMQDYIKATKQYFDPSLYILRVDIIDLLLEDILNAIYQQIVATLESLNKEHN